MSDLIDAVEFGQAYSDLGWAVQEQLRDMVNGDYSDLNPNAVDLIEDRLMGPAHYLDFGEELAEVIAEAREYKEEDEDA